MTSDSAEMTGVGGSTSTTDGATEGRDDRTCLWKAAAAVIKNRNPHLLNFDIGYLTY
jgi:hypothetical protein